jgi:hypothetical protein
LIDDFDNCLERIINKKSDIITKKNKVSRDFILRIKKIGERNKGRKKGIKLLVYRISPPYILKGTRHHQCADDHGPPSIIFRIEEIKLNKEVNPSWGQVNNDIFRSNYINL